MGTSAFDPVVDRRAWNAGIKVGAKRPLKPKQVWAIRFFLDQHCRVRDRALLDLALDSKLRGCDVVGINEAEVAPVWWSRSGSTGGFDAGRGRSLILPTRHEADHARDCSGRCSRDRPEAAFHGTGLSGEKDR